MLGGQVEAARQADADSLEFTVGVQLHLVADPSGQAFYGNPRIGRSLHRFLREKTSVDVRHRDSSLHRPEIGHYNCALIVEPQESRTSSARQASGRAVDHPIFANELL